MAAQTVTEFAESCGWTLDVVDGPELTTDSHGWEHYASTLELSRPTPDGVRTLRVPWHAGTGAGPDAPSLAVLLDAVISDAATGALDFPDFVDEYGVTDVRSGYATWQACQRARESFVEFVAGDYDVDALSELERDV